MARKRIGAQTVVIVRRGRDDLTGDPVDAQRTDVTGCFVQPTGTSETSGASGGAARASQRARIYGPPQLGDARPDDVIESAGWQFGQPEAARLQVVGAPMVWPDKRGQVDHVELDVELVTG